MYIYDNFSVLSPPATSVTKQLIHGLAQRPHSSHQCNRNENQRQAPTHPGTFAACSKQATVQVARPVMAKSAAPCSQNAAAHISQMWEQLSSSQAPANKAQHTGIRYPRHLVHNNPAPQADTTDEGKGDTTPPVLGTVAQPHRPPGQAR